MNSDPLRGPVHAPRSALRQIDIHSDIHYSNPMSTVDKVKKDAMALSASERASLAHELILSLDHPANYELSPAQEAEIQRRLQMVREGTATGRPAADVFADIQAKFS